MEQIRAATGADNASQGDTVILAGDINDSKITECKSLRKDSQFDSR
jgi:hypothetical protein